MMLMSLGVILILIGAALADSTTIIPTAILIAIGGAMIIGGRICTKLS